MENEIKPQFIPTSAGSVIVRTEVSIGAQTWVYTTTWIGVDSKTGEDEYETTITEPGASDPKPVRRCLTQQRAHQVHQTFVNDLIDSAHGHADIKSGP